MKTYANAKKLLLILSLGFLGQSFASPYPKLECGTYKAKAMLRQNSAGHFILSFQEESYSPYELILLGGSIREKLNSLDVPVEVEFYVPKALKTAHRPIVHLQKFVSESPASYKKEGIEKIESRSCKY